MQNPPVHLRVQGDTPKVILELTATGQSIPLILPELVSDRNRRLIYSFDNLQRVSWESCEHGMSTAHWSQESLGSFTLKATPHQDGLLIDWTIQNLSDEPWPYCSGVVCMQTGAPSDRIFLRCDGRWISHADASPARHHQNWLLPPGREPCEVMGPYIKSGSYQLGSFRPDEAIAAIPITADTSAPGWFIAQAWHEARYFVINPDRCSDVAPYLGDLSPGQSIRVRGKIYVFEGDLDQLHTRYREDLQTGAIGLSDT